MGIGFRTPTSLAFRVLVIAAVVVVLLIPLTMLRSLVSERTGLREQARQKVAQGWGGDLVIGGPMLVIPTLKTVTEGEKTRLERSALYVLPERLDVNVDLMLEEKPRYVGIYGVPVYLAQTKMSGAFSLDKLKALLNKPGVTYLLEEARIRLPLSEVRSLREIKHARVGDQEIQFGPASPGAYRGVDAAMAVAMLESSGVLTFEFDAVVAGSRDFSVLPVGSTTAVALKSNWPHPSFQGAFLPVQHEIDAGGFTARWQVLELNRTYPQAWMMEELDDAILLESSFGVGLYQAVDVYQRGERAIKYALLFIALTFLTFFAWEQLAGVRLHPFQYLLVGLALSVFYLLLIALSEHVAYAVAYAIAAVGLILLVGVYIAGALRSRFSGLVAGSAMTVVYGLLYVLVLSEDYALLLGAIVLFIALAAVMIATRRVNWYRSAEVAEG